MFPFLFDFLGINPAIDLGAQYFTFCHRVCLVLHAAHTAWLVCAHTLFMTSLLCPGYLLLSLGFTVVYWNNIQTKINKCCCCCLGLLRTNAWSLPSFDATNANQKQFRSKRHSFISLPCSFFPCPKKLLKVTEWMMLHSHRAHLPQWKCTTHSEKFIPKMVCFR